MVKYGDIKYEICSFIKRECDKKDSHRCLIGLSGGLDSTVTAYLSKDALGSENLLGITLLHPYFDNQDLEHAKLVAKILNIEHKIISTLEIHYSFFKGAVPKRIPLFPNSDDYLALFERIASTIFYAWADEDLNNRRVIISSSNKTEHVTSSFFVAGFMGDIFPLGELYKTEVKKLGKFLEIPNNILYKTPSDGFRNRKSDEEILGAPYSIVDRVCYLLEKDVCVNSICELVNADKKFVEDMKYRILDSKLKLEFPVCHVGCRFDRHEIFNKPELQSGENKNETKPETEENEVRTNKDENKIRNGKDEIEEELTCLFNRSGNRRWGNPQYAIAQGAAARSRAGRYHRSRGRRNGGG